MSVPNVEKRFENVAESSSEWPRLTEGDVSGLLLLLLSSSSSFLVTGFLSSLVLLPLSQW
jgi:hypothetical protein